jgi:hypothetical protein
MAHTEASLMAIILSSQAMTVPRLQYIPETMILAKPRLSTFQKPLLIRLTARSSSSNFILT